MSTIDHLEKDPASAPTGAHLPATVATTGPAPARRQTAPDPTESPISGTAAAPALAVLRLAVGFVFLWSFLDKVFGLGYATPSERSWTNGSSPTEGFLSSISVGPLQDTFHSWAGQPWVDGLFMAGLASVGVAVILGIGLRIAAVSGTVMMALLWISQWPPAQHTATGEPTGSNNPAIDAHVIYALALIVVAATRAGHHWGLGRIWVRVPVVRRFAAVLQ
jgi:thiosulfate dehydrogenase [quinone] large subunit